MCIDVVQTPWNVGKIECMHKQWILSSFSPLPRRALTVKLRLNLLFYSHASRARYRYIMCYVYRP